MNPHKESWQRSVGLVPKPYQAPTTYSFIKNMEKKMFTDPSDKTKWERIGRPIFVEQPIALAMLLHPYSPPVLRLKGAVKLYDLYFG